MSDRSDLTDLQLKLLEILWEEGEASVRDVKAALAPERDRARSTIATLLSRLEEKGVVTHREVGRRYLYRPTVDREEVRGALLSDFTDDVFRGSVPELVRQLLELEDVTQEELEQVRRMIEDAHEPGESDDGG